ncbi:hypothetical protein [Limnohabitans sp.]|uniref:hypothetical protein n=1 Tax=Limnohabitans sp. TaxID=1907725 RepID=UPI00286F0CDD|nr:hypothetical protein [Limnohabitans sp.]
MESFMREFFSIILGLGANALIIWVIYSVFFRRREEDPDLIALKQIQDRSYQRGKRSGYDDGFADGQASTH